MTVLTVGQQFFSRSAPTGTRLSALACLWLAVLPAQAEDTTSQADQPTVSADSIRLNSTPLNWYPRAALTAEQAASLPSFCSGMYLPATPVTLPAKRLEAEADHAFMDSDGNAELTGDVTMHYGSTILKSDQASWDAALQHGSFSGDIRVDNGAVVLQGKGASYSHNIAGEAGSDGTGDEVSELKLQQSEYSLPERHMRGSADHMTTRSDGVIALQGATVTWCEPGQNDWQIAASEIHLDQQKGIGSAWNTRLEVMDVPVFYLPYYRFPIDDRRTTGFLDPSFSIGGDAGLQELKTPFYLNLAANLDATITPHYVNEHGWLWENQLRHKTALLGDGELNYAYLNQDASTGDERWLINYRQSGKISERWTHEWIYNHVSDDDYLSDFNSSYGIDRSTHLPRKGRVTYRGDDFTVNLEASEYQTIDSTISLEERPYKRLPQASLNYQKRWQDGWKVSGLLQGSRFLRDQSALIDGTEESLSGFDSLNGNRLVADADLGWRFDNGWSYVEPQVSYRYRAYRLDSHDSSYNYDANQQFVAPRYSLDSGLRFERPLDWFGDQQTQTLEPRLFWVKSPYVAGQDEIPTFDTKITSTSYDSLFTGDRFTGYDRLADLDQVSIGATSRIVDSEGDEWLRFSLGRMYFSGDRRVQIEADEINDSRATSSTLAELEWRPNNNWGIYNTMEWDTYGNFARQSRLGIRYTPETNRMLNLSVNKVQSEDNDTNSIDVDLYQADINGFWAINDSWALTGRVLRDMKQYNAGERRPESAVLESLAGFEYQNCCWRFQLMYKETSPTADDDADYSTNKSNSLMFSIQLKGLTTLGGGTDATLRNSIQGYTRRQYHDY
ncbi:LPS-assembly protein LptD [Oceanobacter mangrovi]|uniref:LPS-assembly protein LptD n=1 Tax=Oceanobacter mangrovi TaxID=2862510 RepID=UPI001C8EE4E6|nr:LPS assembly protein LptD [Oceanobacter mangrovi]